MFFQIQQKLDNISKDRSLRTSLRELKIWLKDQIDPDDIWQEFESQFSRIHGDFLRRLADQFPELTPQQLKICAMIRIELSSKDITNLLYISPRSVGQYRHQIRKILGLSAQQNLTTFLQLF